MIHRDVSHPHPGNDRFGGRARGIGRLWHGNRASELALASRQVEARLEPVTDPVAVSAGELAVRSACRQNDVANRGFRHSGWRRRTVPHQQQIEIIRFSAFTETRGR